MNAFAVTFWLLLATLVPVAELRGSRPERWAGRAFGAAAVLSVALQHFTRERYHGVEYGVAAVDFCLFVALYVIAVRSGRTWLMVATALQAFPVLAHVGKTVNPNFGRLAYAMMTSSSGIPTLVLLAIGMLVHRREGSTGSTFDAYSRRAASAMRRQSPRR